MTFGSLRFLLAAAALAAIANRLPRRPRNLVLAAASYAFAAASSWTFAAILLASTALNYALGIAAEGPGRAGRRAVRTAVVVNLLALAAFKLAGFYVVETTALLARLGLAGTTGALRIAVPVGLSYYVLSAVSYVVDVHRRQMPACRDAVDFALFMGWFPKLTAGPIERARALLPRLASPGPVGAAGLARAAGLVVLGVFRKTVFAGPLLGAVPPDLLRGAAGALSPAELAFGLAAYAFGIYNDFCGYTDIARGVSAAFGIELAPNFRFPFFARSISDFWGRWHVSFTSWLRDYVYLPLSRALIRRSPSSAGGVAALVVPPLATLLASGAWHGPRYLAWGIWMGLLIAAERAWTAWRPAPPPSRRSPAARIAAAAGTFLALSTAITVFAAGLPGLARLAGGLLAPGTWAWPRTRVLLLLPLSLALDLAQSRSPDGFPVRSPGLLPRAAALAAALVAIAFFAQSQLVSPFVYQGF